MKRASSAIAASIFPNSLVYSAAPCGPVYMSFKSFLVVASLAVSVLIGLVIVRGSGASAGAAAAGSGPKVVKIGLSLDTLKEARWAEDRDAFVARAKELGAEVTVLSANSDDTRQVADVESLITSKVDVIVIVPHDGK